MYKKILMPTGGSSCSQRAVREGLEIEAVAARSSLWISPGSMPYGVELIEDARNWRILG